MTFSICVRERYEDDTGEEQVRFGVAVTTRLPGVGARCPFASVHGAIATQSIVNPELGSKGLAYVADGLAIEDALQSLLNADEGASDRQVHGLDRDGTFTHTGADCAPWCGHTSGSNYTVAGNHLTSSAVVDATAEAFERGDVDDPLSGRLIDALAAGATEGGDDRVEELPIQSAAIKIETTEEFVKPPAYHDLRVDATERPIEALAETHQLARKGYDDFLAHIAED